MLLVFLEWYLKYWLWPMEHLKAWNLSRQFILAVSNRGAQEKDLYLKESSSWQCSINIALQFSHCPYFYLTEFIAGIRRACKDFVDLEAFFLQPHWEFCAVSNAEFAFIPDLQKISTDWKLFIHICSYSWFLKYLFCKVLRFSSGSCKSNLTHCCELQREHCGWMILQLRRVMLVTECKIIIERHT